MIAFGGIHQNKHSLPHTAIVALRNLDRILKAPFEKLTRSGIFGPWNIFETSAVCIQKNIFIFTENYI